MAALHILPPIIALGSNGTIYIDSSNNLEGIRTSKMFQLRMGKAVFKPELQKDLRDFGQKSTGDRFPQQASYLRNMVYSVTWE